MRYSEAIEQEEAHLQQLAVSCTSCMQSTNCKELKNEMTVPNSTSASTEHSAIGLDLHVAVVDDRSLIVAIEVVISVATAAAAVATQFLRYVVTRSPT